MRPRTRPPMPVFLFNSLFNFENPPGKNRSEWQKPRTVRSIRFLQAPVNKSHGDHPMPMLQRWCGFSSGEWVCCSLFTLFSNGGIRARVSGKRHSQVEKYSQNDLRQLRNVGSINSDGFARLLKPSDLFGISRDRLISRSPPKSALDSTACTMLCYQKAT